MKQLIAKTIAPIVLAGLFIPQPTAGAKVPADLRPALSEDAAVSEPAIQRLRKEGREAFDRLLAYRERIERDSSNQAAIDLEKLDRVIDRVGVARYSSVSGLYWHTDFQKALSQAQEENKPILSLRMMGQLTDEYSCANSRFFRTTLYANQQISQQLRENFVLHWKSVRPVPKVTIDYGDGRKLERTLTGNSIHYALTSDGRVIDGLPGLYSPNRFLAWLTQTKAAVNFVDRSGESPFLGRPDGNQKNWNRFLKQWHLNRAAAIARRWENDLGQVARLKTQENASDQNVPPAKLAAMRALPKAAIEVPIIANVVRDIRVLEEKTSQADWKAIAKVNRKADEKVLDQTSIALIRSENPVIATDPSGNPSNNDQSFDRLIETFERNIAIDTYRNEYLLHSQLHHWFAEGKAPADLEKLNEKVYAELFLTPEGDPWIGLVPPNIYTGLNNGGVVESD